MTVVGAVSRSMQVPCFLAKSLMLHPLGLTAIPPKYFHGKGVLFTHLFPKCAKPFCPLFWLHHPEMLNNDINFQRAYQWMKAGRTGIPWKGILRASMKKRLIFVNNNLHTGGIQQSLLDLLSNLQGFYEIPLLMMTDSGEYKDSLPKGIDVLRCSPLLRILGMSPEELWCKAKRFYAVHSLFVSSCRLAGNSFPLRVLAALQTRLGPYDAAISCMQREPAPISSGGVNEIVLSHILAAETIP